MEGIYILENFLHATFLHTFDFQYVKNIFGKLFLKEKVAKENIW